MFKDTISIEVEVREAITFENVDDIGIDQAYEYLEGWFPVYVELIEETSQLKDIIEGLNMDSNSVVIASNADYDFKRGDLVRLYDRDVYKVKAVRKTVDTRFNNVIRLFPNTKRQYTWSVIQLGE